MNIREAIERTDARKPNSYPEEDKILWLDKVEGMIKRFIIDTHADRELVSFTGYDMDTDRETNLLAPKPFSDLYLRWLEAQIDLANGDYDSYNASIALYNTEYEAYENDYNRSHTPISKGRFRF